MTNGEKIIEMFPNAEINYGLRGIVAVTFIHKTIFDLDWWNDEYKELTNKIDCDNTDCNNCVNHKYCDYESNKLGNSTSSDDCISRANALRVAKNEYLRGWHNALCKALSEKYSIHCEEGDFSVIQEETITGLGLSMNCAVGKDVESYMSSIPSVTPIRPKGHWINHSDEGYVECPKCGSATNCDDNINDLHFCFSCGAEMESEDKE